MRDAYPEEVAASREEGVVIHEHPVSEQHVVNIAFSPGSGKPPFTLILEKLLRERKLVRIQEEAEEDPGKKAVLHARQMAKKVAANSSYGLLGATKGYLPLPDLAAVTTFRGRRALAHTQAKAERVYGAKVVAGDTDSVMILLPADPNAQDGTPEERKAARMKYVFEKGAEIGKAISAVLPPPLELELEGVMWPVLFLKKKCYAAELWMNPSQPKDKMKLRGIVAVRNDYALIAKELSTKVLKLAIKENKPVEAVQHLKRTIEDMKAGSLPMEKYIIAKQLHDMNPKVVSPHVALCQRLQLTARLEVPPLGTRVQYVIVKGGGELSSRSRRPQDTTVDRIDTAWYIEGLLKHLTEIMGYFVPGGKQGLHRILNDQGTLYQCSEVRGKLRVPVRPQPVTTLAGKQAKQVKISALLQVVTAAEADNEEQQLAQAVAAAKAAVAVHNTQAKTRKSSTAAAKPKKQTTLKFGVNC